MTIVDPAKLAAEIARKEGALESAREAAIRLADLADEMDREVEYLEGVLLRLRQLQRSIGGEQ